MKIHTKLMLCFLLVIAVPTVLVTGVVFIGSQRIITDQMDELAEKNLHVASLVLQQRLIYINELSTLISMNPLIREVLSSDATDNFSQNISEILQLDRALDSYYISNTYSPHSFPIVPSIYLVNKPAYRGFAVSSHIRDVQEIADTPWYLDMAHKSISTIVDAPRGKLIVARKLFDLRNVDISSYAALLTIEMDISDFNNLLHTYKSFPSSRIYVLDEHSNIVMRSNALSEQEANLFFEGTFVGTETRRVTLNHMRAIVSFEPMGTPNWHIVSLTYLNEIDAQQRRLTEIVVTVVTICVLLTLLLALVLSRFISDPITKLVASMRSVSDNNFEIDIDYRKNDEFGYLIGQYRSMIEQIRDLINDLYISEMHKQSAELRAKDAHLRALQAQINPHFLYNTLDSINLYAIKHDVPIISDMIDALADFFRYTLNTGQNIITLGEEMVHTKNYLRLQTFRLGSDLHYSFHVPGELRNTRIVKLVIQPLVENAIQHGFADQSPQMELSVSALREEDRIIITVSDNGQGADIAQLTRLLEGPDSLPSQGFAISNVHRRLQGAFGPAYGLRYRARENGGLHVDIVIPALYGTEEAVIDL